jgi:two-component system, NarL family, invasion response regulator UvrY
MNALIVDEHPMMRRAVRELLEEEFDLQSCEEAATVQEALQAFRRSSFDVAIVAISLPGKNGLDLLMESKKSRPRTRILFFTMHSENRFAVRAIKMGAAGYLTKTASRKELAKAVRKVVNGGTYISLSVAEQIADVLSRNGKHHLPHELLSEREYEIMCLLAVGRRVKEIAAVLLLSPGTIHTYRQRVLKKMKLRNEVELAHYARDNGLID